MVYDREYMDRLDYEQNPKKVPCAYCGEIARGYAVINGERVCHPNNSEAPDCYTLASRDPLTRALSLAWAEPGVPVTVTDPEALAKVAALLGGKR